MDIKEIFRKGLSAKGWQIVDAYRKTGDVTPLAKAVVEDPDILKYESMRSFISGVLLGDIKPFKDRPKKGIVARNKEIICFVEMCWGMGYPKKLSYDYQGVKSDACTLAAEKFGLSSETIYKDILNGKRRKKWWDVPDGFIYRWYWLGEELYWFNDEKKPENLQEIERLDKKWREISPADKGKIMQSWWARGYGCLPENAFTVNPSVDD